MTTKTKASKSKSSGVCHFTVTGEFVTRHARDLVLEDVWEDAIRFLKTSLIGISYDQVIDILSGTHELTGENNNILMRHKCNVPYMEKLDEKYGHFVYIDRKWFEPISYITSYGPPDWKPIAEDFKTRCRTEQDMKDMKDQIGILRSAHYVETNKDKIYPLICPDKSTHMVIFTPVEQNPPVWMDVQRSPQEAVNVAKRLKVDGFHVRYPDFDFSDYNPGSIKTILSLDDSEDNVIVEDKSTLNYFKDSIQEFAPRPDTKLEGNFGWISPTGEFYACGYGGHINASEIIIRHQYPEAAEKYGNTEKFLEDNNWIKIGGGGKYNYFATKSNPTLSQHQHDTIWDWCQKHDQKFPEYLFNPDKDYDE